LQPLQTRLGELASAALPESLREAREKLLADAARYVISGGTDGTLPQILGPWRDFQQDYRHQYSSEHAGLHDGLRQVRDAVVNGDELRTLGQLAAVEGLSAHYNPERIRRELNDRLRGVGVTRICERAGAVLEADLQHSWACSDCGYRIGTPAQLPAEELLGLIRTGIGEYLQTVRGCAADLRDYVADHPEAAPLLGLLEEPPDAGLASLADAGMQAHLAAALADARAHRVDLEQLLAALKPRLLGYYAGGEAEFRQRVAGELERALAGNGNAGQAWKVE
jgi:hypothetical protein